MLNTQTQQEHQILLDQMETMLAHLAMYWRSTPSPEDEAEIVRRYQIILTTLIELGLDHPLDIDSELPDELMPPIYFEQFS